MIDVIILILALTATICSWYVWWMVRGNGRILTSLAFTWATFVRALSVDADISGRVYPAVQLQIGFWVLIVTGFLMLIYELRKTLRKKRSWWSKMLSAWRD